MIDLEDLERACNGGISYISQQQSPDGGFTSCSSKSKSVFTSHISYSTNFVPALILGCLASVNIPTSSSIKENIANYILSNRSNHWTFNYWNRKTAEAQHLPYPDDLDDTACSLIGLWTNDHDSLNEAAMASVVKLLVASEVRPGGPYRTWLVAPESNPKWQDVDLAVNANFAYLLTLITKPLPNIVNFIDEAIINRNLSSPYYPSIYPLLYYISRGYSGKHRTTLVTIIKKEIVLVNNSLHLALLLSALLHLHERVTSSQISSLLKAQNKDGSWPADAFCMDPSIKNIPYYHGAAVLTTAFVLETLNLYMTSLYQSSSKNKENNNLNTKAPNHSVNAKLLKQKVLLLAQKQNEGLVKSVRVILMTELSKILHSSGGDEIVSIPLIVNESLKKPFPKVEVMIEQLALANTYGWLAYTVYDDFLDDEGQPSQLPLANIAMRRSQHCFRDAMGDDHDFQDLVRKFFDSIDTANYWEVTHCRAAISSGRIDLPTLPAFGHLAQLGDKSCGHLLPALAIFLKSGILPGSLDFNNILPALRQYIIVRQLNDDMHDWQQDLERGHLSYVVTTILKELAIAPGQYRVNILTTSMQQQFWNKTIVIISKQMQQLLTSAEQMLAKVNALKPDNPLQDMLKRQQASIYKTLSEQASVHRFLTAYKS